MRKLNQKLQERIIHHNQMGFISDIQSGFNTQILVNVTYYIKIPKKRKNHMNISICR